MKVSEKGLKLLLDYEVGGGEPYYRKFLSRPTWAGERSGVTIGIGFDLGYNTQAQVMAAWGGVLADSNVELLKEAVGIVGEAAKQWLASREDVRGVEVPWEKAVDVFGRVTVPQFYSLTLQTYPQASTLPAECRDALISLVFNRGSALSGERRIEMMGILNCLREGRLQDIPSLFRSMTRLWPNTTGLQKRRMAEAALFEEGLGR